MAHKGVVVVDVAINKSDAGIEARNVHNPALGSQGSIYVLLIAAAS